VCLEGALFARNAVPFGSLTSGYRAVYRRAFVVSLGWMFARDAAQVTYIPQDIVQYIGEGFVSIKSALVARNAIPFDTLTSVFRAVHRRAFVVSLGWLFARKAAPLTYIPQDIVQDTGEGVVSLESNLFARNAVPLDILTSGYRAVYRRAFVGSLGWLSARDAAPLTYIPQDIVQDIDEGVVSLGSDLPARNTLPFDILTSGYRSGYWRAFDRSPGWPDIAPLAHLLPDICQHIDEYVGPHSVLTSAEVKARLKVRSNLSAQVAPLVSNAGIRAKNGVESRVEIGCVAILSSLCTFGRCEF
jgi:roadblock/LC7 domain-containing protein